MWELIENTPVHSYWYNPESGVVNVGHGSHPPKTSGGYHNLSSLAYLKGDKISTPDIILNYRGHIERYMILGCTVDQATESTFKVFGEPSQYIIDQLKKDIQK